VGRSEGETMILSIILSIIGGIITGYSLSGDIILYPLYFAGIIMVFISGYLSPDIRGVCALLFLVAGFITALKYQHIPPALER